MKTNKEMLIDISAYTGFSDTCFIPEEVYWKEGSIKVFLEGVVLPSEFAEIKGWLEVALYKPAESIDDVLAYENNWASCYLWLIKPPYLGGIQND